MDEILNLSINEMPQTEFDCSCGKHHNFSVHDMSIRKGAIEDLPKMAEPFKDGKILVVFDNHTYKVAGKRAVELLKENGFNVMDYALMRLDKRLLPQCHEPNDSELEAAGLTPEGAYVPPTLSLRHLKIPDLNFLRESSHSSTENKNNNSNDYTKE